MRPLRLLLIPLLLLAGCGGDGDGDAGGGNDSAARTNAITTAPATTETEKATTAVNVTGQETLVVLADDLLAQLEQQDVAVEPLAPATLDGGELTLPITGGRVQLDQAQGTIEHAGGLAFVKGETRVPVRDPFVDTRSGTVYGLVGGSRVRMFTLDAGSVDVQKRDDHVVAGAFDVRFAEDGVAVLNEELGAGIETGASLGSMRVRLVPILPGAAGAPDAAGDALDLETRDLEAQVRDIRDRALEDIGPEERDRLEDLATDLQRALEAR